MIHIRKWKWKLPFFYARQVRHVAVLVSTCTRISGFALLQLCHRSVHVISGASQQTSGKWDRFVFKVHVPACLPACQAPAAFVARWHPAGTRPTPATKLTLLVINNYIRSISLATGRHVLRTGRAWVDHRVPFRPPVQKCTAESRTRWPTRQAPWLHGSMAPFHGPFRLHLPRLPDLAGRRHLLVVSTPHLLYMAEPCWVSRGRFSLVCLVALPWPRLQGRSTCG